MKTTSPLRASLALALLGTLYVSRGTGLAQGSLIPPGPPAPGMKTLAQIEPRTPISSVPFTISEPGSYYLTTNVTVSSGDAITIATNNVTLDLNGFTISSTALNAIGNGIRLAGGLRNITLANGFIQGGVTNNGSGFYSGSGFGYGIAYSVAAPVNVLVSSISVSGCLNNGIYLGRGDSTVVDSCTVRTVGGYGLNASTVKQSSAVDCGTYAISGDQVSDCRGQSSGGSEGIYALTAQNCYGASNGGGDGVYAGTALNCYGYGTGSGYGVYATTAQNCYGTSNGGGSGVFAITAQNCYGYSSSGFGLYASGAAIGCYGSSNSGTGLNARSAAYCVGNRGNGTAIQATIAIGCYANSGTNSITYKYNMP